MFTSLGNVIPTDWARRYTFDGSGNSTTGSNNAAVTNPVWVKSQRMYQNQCLSWGATTSCTYASVTYTNSYIWIYSGTTWTFTKNSSKVTATALNGVNGERYAGLTFFNRTLTTDEEQLLQLEGLKLLGPTNIAKHPKLFEGLVGYFDFKGTAHNLVNGVSGTVTGATLTTNRFGHSNSAYSFSGGNNNIAVTGINSGIGGSFTYSFLFKPNSINTAQLFLYDWAGSARNIYFEYTAGGVLNFFRGNGASSQDTALSYSPGFSIGTYYLITITQTGTSKAIYINGNSVATQTSTLSGGTTANTVYISSSAGIDTGANGVIDFSIFFNRALSADEVKLLYTLTSQDYIYPTPSYDLPNLRDGLVLDLNEKGKDLSGNGNHGTLVNAPTVIRQGKAKGLSYNGSNQYIDLPENSSFNFTTEGTISAVIKTTAVSHMVMANYSQVGTGVPIVGYQCYIDANGKTQFNFGTGGNYNPGVTWFGVIGNTAINDGKIHILTWKKTSSNIQVYVDGNLDGTLNTTATIGYSSNIRNNVGVNEAQPGTISNLFNGVIINLRVWNRALSNREIQQLYYSLKGNYIY